MKRQTVALYGGSFDPPHMVHLLATTYVLHALPVEEVWWIPVWKHAFESKSDLTPYSQRLEMCHLAIGEMGPQVKISEVERDMGGVNRTIDTVEHLQHTFPHLGFRIVIGTDVLQERHLWKEFDRLLELAPPIVLGRADYPCPSGFEASPPFPNINSTSIRNSLQEGQELKGQVPLEVEKYIRAKNLYLEAERI